MGNDAGWLAEHLSTIGGTAATVVMGVNRFVPFDELWWNMKRARTGELPERAETPDLKRGRMLEPIARQIMSEEFKLKVEPHDQSQFCYNASLPWAHTLPDAWIINSDESETPGEIKVPRPVTFRKLLMVGLTDEYMVQCQHAMTVLDFDHIQFAALDPVTMDIISQRIERDWEFCEYLTKQERVFFESLDGDAPPPAPKPKDASPFDNPDEVPVPKSEGKAKIITDEDAIIMATACAEAWIDNRMSAQNYDLARAMYRQAIGEDCKLSQVPGVLTGNEYTIKGRRKIDIDAALKRHPDLKNLVEVGRDSTGYRITVDPAFLALRG